MLPHTHTSDLMWVRSSDRRENNLRIQWNNGHRKEERVLLTWAGCPSFLKGTHWVYSGRYETMVHNRSAKKSIISRDGKIQLTLAFYVKTRGKWPIGSYSLQYKYEPMKISFLLLLALIDALTYTTTHFFVDSGQLQWSKSPSILYFKFYSVFSVYNLEETKMFCEITFSWSEHLFWALLTPPIQKDLEGAFKIYLFVHLLI